MKQTGLFLKALRMNLGLTQKQIADELGYTAQYIMNIERGVSNPPAHCIKRLAKMLKTSKHAIIENMIQDYESNLKREVR